MQDSKGKNHEIAMIAVSVAMLIGGGIAIYAVSAAFPVPGTKYIMMAPLLSNVIYVIQIRLAGKYTILKLGAVFALTMAIVNLFMSAAIVATTLLTHLSIAWIKDVQRKAFWGSVLFASYTGLTALSVTKAFIGGLLDDVPYSVFVIIAFLCAAFGVLGSSIAKRIIRHLNGYDFNGDRYN